MSHGEMRWNELLDLFMFTGIPKPMHSGCGRLYKTMFVRSGDTLLQCVLMLQSCTPLTNSAAAAGLGLRSIRFEPAAGPTVGNDQGFRRLCSCILRIVFEAHATYTTTDWNLVGIPVSNEKFGYMNDSFFLLTT